MSQGNARTKDGTRWRKNRQMLRARGEPCWICREFGRTGEIDYSLPHLHPFAFKLDHLVPISKGGDPFDPRNCAATHRCCNQWRSNMSVEDVKKAARSNDPTRRPPRAARAKGKTSREW